MKRLVLVMLASAVSGGVAQAKNTPILAMAADVNHVQQIQSIEYRARGRYYQFGQAAAPELPWPPFDVDDYVATLDYAHASVHAKYHRTQVQEPGRARPHSEQTQDQYAVGGMTWNLAPGPVAMPANLAERNAELWASPAGFIKAAISHEAQVVKRGDGTVVVSFTLQGKYRYEGVLSAGYDVLSVKTFMDSPVLGDTPIEFRYLEYRDFAGQRFPARIERSVAGLPWYQLTVSELRVNVAQPFAVPPEIAAHPVPSVADVEVTEMAPGLMLFAGGTHNSVIVEQGAGVVVIEAPLSEQRSLAVMAKVHELFPGKRIIGVVNTHTHFDHASGLRTYVAEGIPVITLQRNADYFARVWQQPHTLDPDRLAAIGRKPQFRAFTTKLLLEDPTHPIELHEIIGSGHNDAFAMAYLPRDRVLVEADAWTPAPAGSKPAAPVNPLWLNLYDNIQRLKLEVQRIAPLHGGVRSLDDFRAALAAGTGLQ